MEETYTLNQIWTRFIANMAALEAFSKEIGQMADVEDSYQRKLVLENLAELFNENVSEIEKEIDSLDLPSDDAEIEYTPEQLQKWKNEFKEFAAPEATESMGNWIKNNPRKVPQLYNLVQMLKQPSAHGKILRRGVLIMLTSFFEILLSDIIHFYYFKYPNALPKPEEKAINLAELRKMGSVSIENIEQYFLIQEVERVIRGGFYKTLKYFSDNLHIDLRNLTTFQKQITEITQRRNLLVHNDGVVNEQYLANVSSEYVVDLGIEKGCRLNVTKNYLLRSFDAVYLFSLMLTQFCWRKWEKDDELIDKSILEFMVYALSRERYTLVIDSVVFIRKLKLEKSVYRFVVINHAIAERELGDERKVHSLVSKCDWLPMTIDVQIALSVLRKNYEETYRLLKEAKDSNEIINIMPEWPLFKPIKHTSEFIEIFDE